MKNIKNIFFAGMLALCSMNLATCSDKETYDFPGDPHNRVYMPGKSGTYRILQTPVGSTSDLYFETSLKCTQKASGNIKATVKIDNSMIAAYNKEHGTGYEEMPASALVIENATMNIPAGALISTDTLRLSLSKDENVVKTLKSQQGYLIPLRLTTTEGGDSQPSSNAFSSYLIVTVKEDNVKHGAAESDITGTLVTNQSGWSATTNGTEYISPWYAPISTLFDNNGATYCLLASSTDLNLDINMGKPYTFDAITLWQGASIGRLSAGMTIYTSNDGTVWRLAGEITGKASKFCVFHAPITAQYIRLIIPKGNDSNAILMAGAFNVYAK
jgi:hypothetical protein